MTPSADLRAVWARIGAELDAACAAMPPAVRERPGDGGPFRSLAAYREYAAANEWELAFDALAAVARRVRAGRTVRRRLANAAGVMQDTDRAASWRSR